MDIDDTNYSWYSKHARGCMPISGKEILRLFIGAGWIMLRQKGSHVIIGKESQRECIPMHRELKKGLESKLRRRLAESRDQK